MPYSSIKGYWAPFNPKPYRTLKGNPKYSLTKGFRFLGFRGP